VAHDGTNDQNDETLAAKDPMLVWVGDVERAYKNCALGSEGRARKSAVTPAFDRVKDG
jgi:hypothetical protein